jgi:Asp/Glu/hydantoin racemase
MAETSRVALAAPQPEQFCTHKSGGRDFKGETIACYSDAGCKFAASLGAEPIRDFDSASAPFALARGKIVGIVTSSALMLKKIKQVGGSCRRI